MSNLLNKYTLYAIRSNDIFPTVSRAINPELSTKLKHTIDIGALSNLIKIIKNTRVLIEKDRFEYLASNLGINHYALEHYLRDLHNIGVINVANNKIENTVPSASLDIYEKLGQILESKKPSELEIQHFELINNVSEIPSRAVDLFHSVDINASNLKLFKSIGQSCGYLESYVSPADSSEIIYSPIYWEENPEKLFTLIDKYQYDRVINKISTIRTTQGKPLNDVTQDTLLSEAVATGCLPTNSVTSAGGEQFFVFTPNLGVNIYEKDMVKKARQIVASCRYGENFAQITKIKSIRAVLGALLDYRGKIGDHTENIHQYGMLIEMGLVFPVKARYGHEIHFNDTQENRKIFDLALELLRTGHITDRETMIQESDLQAVFRGNKSFNDELAVITKFKKRIPSSSDTLQRLGDYLRGVDDDVL